MENINIIEKDLLSVEEGVICHQVNCMGVMGSGVALQIKNKYPQVFEEYRDLYASYKQNPHRLLGQVQQIEINPNLFVVNIFGQYDYGVGTKHTEYSAWITAMNGLFITMDNLRQSGHTADSDFYFPYLVGCHRGGGDFKIISKIISDVLINPIYCKLDKN